MKIYSLKEVLKKVCFFSNVLFFVNFIVCFLLKVEFNAMVWLTMPFILIVLAAFSTVCFIDEFFLQNKCTVQNKCKIINIKNYKERNNYKFSECGDSSEFEKSSVC